MKTLLILLFFPCLFINAQRPEQVLAKWSANARIEKIHLHFDREKYLAGETIWFKAYLSSDQLPDTISSTLYAEIFNEQGKIIQRRILPVVAGTSRGNFELPDSLHAGNYLVTAFTSQMIDAGPEFIFRRKIYVYGKELKNAQPGHAAIRMEFFPEAGNLIEGKNNSVAFRISNQDGLPVSANGKITDEQGAEVGSFAAYHDGLGYFEINPKHGHTYRALIDTNHFALPAASEKGILFSLVPHPQGHYFEIDQNKGDASLRASFIIGQMQHQPVFRMELAQGKEELQGVINTGSLQSGIMQVTVFNKDGYPLAERLCFVNNREYEIRAELTFDTLDTNPRARNHFLLKMKDTVQGSFSVSVTDADFDNGEFRKNNIYSQLLISGDLPGFINDPAWYFRTGADSASNALDLLMMTNGWRRFKWTKLLNENINQNQKKQNGFITLKGKALIRDTKRPFADHALMVMIYDASKNRITQLTKTDSRGNFQIDSLVFYGRNRLIFSDVKGKKSEYLDIVMSADSLSRPFSIPAATADWFHDPAPGPLNAFANDLDAILKASGLMLENVTIKAVKKSALQELEEKYTKGAFSGPTEKTIDLVNSNEAEIYPNIFDYLQARVNGLVVNRDGADYSLQYRQSASISSMGAFPMVLFLDEVETDASFIAAIPASQVALVKVFPNFVASNGNAPGGALAIYTKKGADYTSSRGSMNFGYYDGYSITKEFYAPDYRVKDEGKPDSRITLDWRPDIFCNYVDPVLPFSFYNSDRTKKFRVVIEGMTTNGKLFSIEKVLAK